jgi:acetyl esterase/lipase
MIRFLLAGFLLSVAACTSIGTSLANLPVSYGTDRIRTDVAYGGKSWQKLDLYFPRDAGKAKLPIIVFFYGGRWTVGEKEIYPFVADAFTRKGYIVAIPDYAKFPLVKFPAFIEDAAAAIAWLHNNADTLRIDRDRLFVMGHSAGAHIGALVSTDSRYLKTQGGKRSWIAGFAGLAGPYAFTPDEPDLIEMFGPPEHYPLMQVPSFIDGRQPPMLLLHGGRDDVVGQFNMEKVKEAVEDKGGVVETHLYPDLDHIDIVAAFSWIYSDKASVAGDIDRFFRRIRPQRIKKITYNKG